MPWIELLEKEERTGEIEEEMKEELEIKRKSWSK